MLPFLRLVPVPDPKPGASTAGPIRIVLADDHTAMRQNLRLLLDGEADLDVVAETDSLRSVMRHVRTRRPDVLVLDLGPVSYTHLRAHETRHDLVCRLLLEKKK